MTANHFCTAAKRAGFSLVATIGILGIAAALACAQLPPQGTAPSFKDAGRAILQGHVRDVDGKPLADSTVVLSAAPGSPPGFQPRTAHTDAEGSYRFASLTSGVYTLRAGIDHGTATVGPMNLATEEIRTVDLTLDGHLDKTGPADSSAIAPEFFDEPKFTVAGITPASNAGGHGSDTALRTTEALAKSTLALSAGVDSPQEPLTSSMLEDLQRASRLRPDDATLHHRIGDAEEKLGNPLAAVREYQQAAELDPSEPNLFDWGTELLTHRALEPAIQVFAQANRLFPKSARVLVALGVTSYARGLYDQAVRFVIEASDLAPSDPAPYLFLGRMQSGETPLPGPAVERLARFAQAQSNNALANYYYAIALSRQSDGMAESERSAKVETLLRKSLEIDANLGAAALQLGIIYARREDSANAIAAFRKAIQSSSDADESAAEAHYRLAQLYVHIGDKIDAQAELEQYRAIRLKSEEQEEQRRQSILEFVTSFQSVNVPRQPH